MQNVGECEFEFEYEQQYADRRRAALEALALFGHQHIHIGFEHHMRRDGRYGRDLVFASLGRFRAHVRIGPRLRFHFFLLPRYWPLARLHIDTDADARTDAHVSCVGAEASFTRADVGANSRHAGAHTRIDACAYVSCACD